MAAAVPKVSDTQPDAGAQTHVNSHGRVSSVVFVRHGETDWNNQRRFQGHRDVPLNSTGRAQAESAAERFPVDLPVRLVSSDLGRAQETAGYLADRLSADVLLDQSFRETFGGSWEGLTHDEILADDADTFRRWRTAEDVRPGKHGESIRDVSERVVTGIERHLPEVPDGGRLVVVTHGGAVRSAVARMTGLPFAHLGSLMVLRNCATATLVPALGIDALSQPHGAWRIASYNV